MSGGHVCHCLDKGLDLHRNEIGAPPGELSDLRKTYWRVWQRHCNHSAFSGYHYTPSDWSAITCLRCRASWRTKASYVGMLPDAQQGE